MLWVREFGCVCVCNLQVKNSKELNNNPNPLFPQQQKILTTRILRTNHWSSKFRRKKKIHFTTTITNKILTTFNTYQILYIYIYSYSIDRIHELKKLPTNIITQVHSQFVVESTVTVLLVFFFTFYIINHPTTQQNKTKQKKTIFRAQTSHSKLQSTSY